MCGYEFLRSSPIGKSVSEAVSEAFQPESPTLPDQGKPAVPRGPH